MLRSVRCRTNYSTFYIYVPPAWHLVVVYNHVTTAQVFYLYSDTYYINFAYPLKSAQIKVHWNPTLVALTLKQTPQCATNYFANLQQVITAFYQPFFRKLKFKGKGYYIYKNKRSTITPQFGYSHRLYTYAFFTSVRFLSKTSILVFGYNQAEVTDISFRIRSMRPINIFTGRGVRFTKQVVYKKPGKISSYR